MSRAVRIFVVTVALTFRLTPAQAEEKPKPASPIPVLLDFDVGTDVDDAFALGLILASPELELRGVTTVGDEAEDRAWLACRFLTLCGRSGIPVAFGRSPQPATKVEGQIQYRRHPAAIFNRTMKPVKRTAVEQMFEQLKEKPGELTIVAIGPLTNVARLLTERPEAGPMIRRIVLMGGSVRVGYSGKPPIEPEWNLKLDPAAARKVFTSGVPLVVAPLDATASTKLTKPLRDRLFAAHTPLTWQLQNLYELWGHETPTLFDPVAVASVFDESFCRWEDLSISIDDRGQTVEGKGKPNAHVAVSIDHAKFLDWYVDRVAKVGEPTLPRAPQNPSKLIEAGNFPARVHVAEDYDTDVERRWWMSGKEEKHDLPEGSRRACRAVLTQDFDDRQGDMKATSRAVIFNPVPGPPMGPNTRLAFRYKLKGTDTIRVQLYSLTNGYHRYLSVGGLPQGEWRSGAVDMTAMRRPDGTGGPLAADERIDDIQFYIDPLAELLIDDVVLYDAAAENETRPFPRRILFTGWFDTGKQGQEWPGTFEIVPHTAPRTWKCARSVKNEELGHPWIRLSLRGDRRLAETNELSFQSRLTGADRFQVVLSRGGKPVESLATRTHVAKGDDWERGTLRFDSPQATKSDVLVDEIRFLIPAGGELRIDDVLLYEPSADKTTKGS